MKYNDLVEPTGYRNELVIAPFVMDGRIYPTALRLVATDGADNIPPVPTVTMWVAGNYVVKMGLDDMRLLADSIHLACDIAETMTATDDEQ